MKVGGSTKFVIPSELAYGDSGAPPKIRGGETLVFQVELLGIEKHQLKQQHLQNLRNKEIKSLTLS